MPDKKEKKDKTSKKAIALAAAAAAAAVTPQAAEVVVQRTELPAPAPPTKVDVPEPPRFEYSKPRPLKTIGDLLRGALGAGEAGSQTTPTNPGPSSEQPADNERV